MRLFRAVQETAGVRSPRSRSAAPMTAPGSSTFTSRGRVTGRAWAPRARPCSSQALTAHFLYQYMHIWLGKAGMSESAARPAAIYIIGGLLIAFGLFVWYLMNKPTNADFLIATDSEMKKVNWTSKRELIGSTKVVIIFMFLIAFLLFAFDIIFGYLFYFMDVLKSKPF
jgi:preprotein translocase subunit SecE